MASTTIRVPTTAQDGSSGDKKKKQQSKKKTFMLHDPSDMSALGRFVSTDWRYAALKAASRDHTNIVLRQTGTREVRKFTGSKVPIEPKQITRGGRTISYTHRPSVKYLGTFTYDGLIEKP